MKKVDPGVRESIAAISVVIVAFGLIVLFRAGMSYAETLLIEAHNTGYRAGMQYAYDNVVVCGANPEIEGMAINKIRTELGEYKENMISCEE